jgi:hypothetical protein
VAESPIQLECELIQIVPVGEPRPGSGNIVIGRLVYAHIAEEAWDANRRIDINKIKPVSRLAGNDYSPRHLHAKEIHLKSSYSETHGDCQALTGASAPAAGTVVRAFGPSRSTIIWFSLVRNW